MHPLLALAARRREQAAAWDRLETELRNEAAAKRADAARYEAIVARVSSPTERDRRQSMRETRQITPDGVREVESA
jgi:hypothetical protein